jgi:pre-rRNA-processing protein TSR3
MKWSVGNTPAGHFRVRQSADPVDLEYSVRYPETVIVVHPKERRSKCTILPLRSMSEQFRLRFSRSASAQATGSVDGYIRLDVAGPPLTLADNARGLLILDGSWRWVEDLAIPFGHLETRSISGIQTAYPRTSSFGAMPEGGLATVEALYAAHRILGRPLENLLDTYFWADEFLARNSWSAPND